jgi:hypothetical protein
MVSSGADRSICRHCARFNPGQAVCRWCGVNAPTNQDAGAKVFAPVALRTRAARAKARLDRFGPEPKGYDERHRYWAAVKAAGLVG